MPSDGGLGTALVGEKIMINTLQIAVTKFLGEGGFSYVYLVKEIADTSTGQSLNNTTHGEIAVGRSGSGSGASRSGSFGNGTNTGSRRQGSVGRADNEKREMVLKVTSIISRQQREIAEKEAKLLSRLSHPSIIKMIEACYRTVTQSASSGVGRFGKGDSDKAKERPQHMILMEYCEGGHSLDVCNQMVEQGTRYDLGTLIIAFGQICNAVSYLHAQRPPIVHRDLKMANFLVKDGAYKLCDFGSAVFGHVDLKTPQNRSEAEEVIEKTTTQMFRAPEMVDLYMCKKLTQATDVWALGVCLYSMAYLQNCFEEGSNLAILSNNYKIPEENHYGEGLVELIDRMLTIDSKHRADMTEVILCLSALYSGRPLPPRKDKKEKTKKDKDASSNGGSSRGSKEKKKKNENAGKFRTDTQGIYNTSLAIDPSEAKKPAQAKKVDPNSVAGRRLRAAGGDPDFASLSNFDEAAVPSSAVDADAAFSTDAVDAFASFPTDLGRSNETSAPDQSDVFATLNDNGEKDADVIAAFDGSQNWGNGSGNLNSFASFAKDCSNSGEDNGESKDEPVSKSEGRRRGTVRREGASSRPDPRSKSRTRIGSRSRARSRTRRRDEPDGRKELAADNATVDDVTNGVEEMGIEQTLEGLQQSLTEDSNAGDNGATEVRRRSGSRRPLRRTLSGGEGLRKLIVGNVRRTLSTAHHGQDPEARQRRTQSDKEGRSSLNSS